MTVTAFASQAVLIPREIMYFGRNISRLYHRHQKLCRVNSILLGKCLSPPFALDTWTVQRTCHGNKSKVDNFPGTLSKQQAKELTAKLTSEEREHFLSALQECKSEEDKAGYQRQLAAFRWCNELGRPTKIPSLGDVDATGKYCRVPDDWLLRKYGPTTKNLVLVAIANAIPFIGFGFLDNFIMIIAGDQIEMILNKKFPISTMAAAALGNTVSDIIGIGSVHYVEIFAHKIGFQAPKLTSIELNLPKTKLAANLGRVVGVTIGCLIGMTPIPLFSYLHNGG
ncbi:uncharacterized protein LOC128891939 isoform X2 [Hylaeus anthracinus]|uniref:uncharacterized protein LOC128891939 isoform X2 n=1 Tax=Hylaeus anthracinus TaxID=313031 RepID=UPI0023BA012C|nr:uncharacterized protein LOC128891939 isoform X2 [Hylaeus anthracinus]